MLSAIVLATAQAVGDDKYHLGLNEWRKLRNVLAAEDAYSIEISEWPDGQWSCTYGLHDGPLVVDLGNMTLAEWFRRERALHSTF